MELTIDQALQQGVAAHKEGRLQEAEKLYRAIIEKQAEHPDANHNLGVLAVGVGQVESALPYFKTALESNPGQGQFWLSYIDALITLDRFDNARDLLQRGKESGLQGEKVDQLEARLGDRVMPSSASNDIAVPAQDEMDRLVSLYSGGNLEEALIQGNTLADQFPHNAVIPNILGAIYFGLDEHETAVVHYGKSIELKPDDPSVHNNLGAALKELGRHEEAITSYHRAIDLNSNDAEPYYNLGTVLSDLGKYEEAIINYNKAIELKPSYAEAHYNLGMALNDLGNYEESIVSYNKAIELKPNYVEAYLNLGNSLKSVDKFDAAIDSWKKTVELKPGFAEAYNNLGLTFQDLGRYKEAITYFDLVGTPESRSQSLECTYIDKDYNEFKRRINLLAKSDEMNIRVAAVSCFVTNQLKIDDPYPFCKKPIDFFHTGNLSNYVKDVDQFTRAIILESEQQNPIWEPKNKTTVSGFQTDLSKTIFEAGTNTNALEKIIKEEVKNYYRNFSSNECRFISSWPEKYSILGWYVRLIKNGHQKAHIHAGGWISGVVYLKTVDTQETNAGAIEVGLHGYDLPIIDNDYPKKTFIPKVGDVILFPSSLFHRTIPFKEDADRCVIAFDIIPREN
jgi:tetratricopeptide (TPR) repeat protein